MTTTDDRPKVYTDAELTYAATARCPCGAGLAHVTKCRAYGPDACWDCSDILTGRAIPSGQEGSNTHTDRMPFTFWKVKSELQPSAGGATTRPRKDDA